MQAMMRWGAIPLFLMLFTGAAAAEEQFAQLLNRPGTPVQVSLESEYGFLGFLHHTIESGPDAATADTFNYITEGGQDILFPFSRLTATVSFGRRHHLRFLYQPLRVETRANFEQDRNIGGTDLSGPVALTYGFPFWRLGYSYDFLAGSRWRLGGGAALQLRNASIIFEALDPSASTQRLFVAQNLGPVPALKLTARYDHPAGWFAGFEAVGLYASSAIINGADFDFEGSLLDTSLRVGLKLNWGLEPFLNLRFLGGSAKGTSENAGDTWTSGSAYTANYLATWSLSLGASLR